MTDQIVSLDRHPILMEQYEVCQAIEVCGASPALTAAATKAGAVLDNLKDLVLLIETKNAEAEYLTECPSCGEGPSKTGFPRMDEDGLCACCGMDCSILGLVSQFKEGEAQIQVLMPQVARLEREKHELESTLHRLVDIAAAAGFQRGGTMLLSDFFYTRLNP